MFYIVVVKQSWIDNSWHGNIICIGFDAYETEIFDQETFVCSWLGIRSDWTSSHPLFVTQIRHGETRALLTGLFWMLSWGAAAWTERCLRFACTLFGCNPELQLSCLAWLVISAGTRFWTPGTGNRICLALMEVINTIGSFFFLLLSFQNNKENVFFLR